MKRATRILITCLLPASAAAGPNLVPTLPGPTPSYWCTWGAQNYAREPVNEFDHSMVAGRLTEENLFGPSGWARAFPEEVRRDLYVVYDLGWDVPEDEEFDDARWKLGWLTVAPGKFPSCRGTATDGLRRLVEMTREAGWRGAGIWVACQARGDGRNGQLLEGPALEAYWRERLRTSRDAGISYWKVDYGARGGDVGYRRMISRLAAEECPDLVVEHGVGVGPLNDWTAWDPEWTTHGTGGYAAWNKGRILADAVELLTFSDVLRTYDVTTQLSLPTTLDRVAQVLAQAESGGVVNCEDEPALAAVLGLAMGVMRHPQWMDVEDKPYDPFRFRDRIDAVTRAVRWQRLAPAVRAGRTSVSLSAHRLVDAWPFREGDSWAPDVNGRAITQTAPAIVARGLPLPDVEARGEAPYVAAARHPDGATAVGTFPRVLAERRLTLPLARVTLDLAPETDVVGVFGRYERLVLRHGEGRTLARVRAQDLAGDEPVDVTDRVELKEGAVVVPGALIDEVGLSAATSGDLSAPGLVLKLEDAGPWAVAP
jgi:hypothetical protein